jgi:hypothetical protein
MMDGTLRLALVLAGLAVVGEAGHVVLDLLNFDLAHHFFHLLFPLVAFVVFAAFAARDIRQHGWPTFSWHLSPSSTLREGD